MSTVASLVGNSDRRREQREAKLLFVRQFAREQALTRETRIKLLTHVKHSKKALSESDEEVSKFLDELPALLRIEVVLHMYRDVIKRIPFLQEDNKTANFVTSLVLLLRHQFHSPDSYIIREGQTAEVVDELTPA